MLAREYIPSFLVWPMYKLRLLLAVISWYQKCGLYMSIYGSNNNIIGQFGVQLRGNGTLLQGFVPAFNAFLNTISISCFGKIYVQGNSYLWKFNCGKYLLHRSVDVGLWDTTQNYNVFTYFCKSGLFYNFITLMHG